MSASEVCRREWRRALCFPMLTEMIFMGCSDIVQGGCGRSGSRQSGEGSSDVCMVLANDGGVSEGLFIGETTGCGKLSKEHNSGRWVCGDLSSGTPGGLVINMGLGNGRLGG